MSSERHRFRFFVDARCETGATVELAAFDARHARVLHGAQTDALIEVVDRDGVLWLGTFDGATARVVVGNRVEVLREPVIVLFAFVGVGGRTDELVDAAVQAGASQVVPVVAGAKDRAKVDARRERLMRISTTAAKQAKRASVPLVLDAIGVDELLDVPPGVIVDPDAQERLDDVSGDAPTRLLVGAADGFPAGLVERLASAGWQRGRLGPTILRSELAAAVAVTIAAMHATRP